MTYLAYIGYMDNTLAHLGEWESSLQRELQDMRQRREALDTGIQRVTKKLELIRQMRLLESPSSDIAEVTEFSPAQDARPTPVAVREGVKKILTDSARPLHISEIHREFLRRSLPIPGGGTAFNILAHVVNDRTFVRVARGTYALAGSVPVAQILPKAQRKARRRRRKKRTSAQNQNEAI